MQGYYLNNRGTKWIIPGAMRFASLENNGPDKITIKIRTADYFEQCGNFAAWAFRVKGERFSAFPEEFATYKGLPLINRTGIAWDDGADIYAKMLGADI